MKKILIALALLIAVFGLVSCEESNQEIDDFVYYALLERYQAILTEFQKFNNDEEPDGITFELTGDDEA